MTINELPKINPEFRKISGQKKLDQDRDKAKRLAKEPVSQKRSAVSIGDRLELSESAKTILERYRNAKNYVSLISSRSTLPPAVEQAIHKKIQEGVYNSEEVREQIAQKLVAVIRSEAGLHSNGRVSEISPDRVAEIKKRIANGTYLTDKVAEIIAQRITDTNSFNED